MKNFLTLTICLIFIGMGSIYSKAEQLENGVKKKHVFEAGTELSYIKYEEPDLMDETGVMNGVFGSYTYNYNDRVMLRAEGKMSLGYVNYDGQLSDGTPYQIDDILDFMMEFRGLVGYEFPILESTSITPYAGFGYRYLNDALDSDPAGYERESNYFYSPIGVKVFSQLEDGWSVGGTAEFDVFWYGLQRSHLEDFSAGLSTLDNDQHEGWGVRGSIRVQKEMSKFCLVIEPFVKYWSIKKSDEADISYSGTYVGKGWEPKNNSIEIGGKIAVIF